ncbi:unnamed protein product, partial [Rotaria sp. Silwood2]
MHSHQHFTRSKTKSNHPSKESTISSSINQLRDSFSMASSFTKAEDSSQSNGDHILNPELHSHFGTQHQTTESKSLPSHYSLKPSPARFSHESGQLLQNEVDRLKAELQMLKSSPQSLIDQINPSNLQSTISCPTNVSTQSSTITSTIPSIQYVINIDPLQQMKDVNLSNRIKSILAQPNQYPHEIFDDGILYKVINRIDGSIIQLPWLPASLIPHVLFVYHDHPMSGHFGVTRPFHKVREQFFFPR